MCEKCSASHLVEHPENPSRRTFLAASAALAAAPLVAGAAGSEKTPAVATGPFPARAYAAPSAARAPQPLQIQRRPLGPNDVLLDVLFCGICHSDVHQARRYSEKVVSKDVRYRFVIDLHAGRNA